MNGLGGRFRQAFGETLARRHQFGSVFFLLRMESFLQTQTLNSSRYAVGLSFWVLPPSPPPPLSVESLLRSAFSPGRNALTPCPCDRPALSPINVSGLVGNIVRPNTLAVRIRVMLVSGLHRLHRWRRPREEVPIRMPLASAGEDRSPCTCPTRGTWVPLWTPRKCPGYYSGSPAPFSQHSVVSLSFGALGTSTSANERLHDRYCTTITLDNLIAP